MSRRLCAHAAEPPRRGPQRPRRARRLATLLLLVLNPDLPLRADTVHLRNGATIEAESWEYRDDQLVVRQRGGSIVVPRREVLRIDPGRREGAALPAAGNGPLQTAPAPATARGGAVTADPGPVLTEADLARAAEEVRRRIREHPLARAENTGRLVVLLNRMAAAAFQGRRYDEALVHLREATSLAPHDHDAQEGLAATYLGLGQDRQARAVIDQALLDHPESPDLLLLLGDVCQVQEKPEEALAAWRKAYALRSDPATRARIEKLQREHAVESGYALAEAAHFTLKYDGARTGSDLEGAIVDYLENEFWNLARRFDHTPAQSITVIVYPEREFHEATLAESNIAGLYDGKIRVPIGGLRTLHAGAKRVLLHELAHAFVADKSRHTAPRWLHEGIAQVVEGLTTDAATGGALARQYRTLADKSRWGQTFSYPSALSFVEFLIEREGFYRLADLLEEMGAGRAYEDACRAATRSTPEELRDAWGKALELKYLH